MSVCVLDASAALSLLSKSQTTPAAEKFLDEMPSEMLAPSVFSLEVRHSLLRLERRKLFPVGDADRDLVALERLLTFDPAPDGTRLSELFALARTERLGIYDAAYLELASRTGARLASRDASLIAAAGRRGVEVVDLR